MKPLEQKKHREFWVKERFDYAMQAAYFQKSQAEDSSWNDSNEIIHVIEYSALIEMEKRAEELVKALEEIKQWTTAIYQHPEHEMRHALAVEIPHYVDEVLENWRKK